MIFVDDEKKQYAKVLAAALKPMRDFGAIEYAKNDITQQEYLRISDKLGSVAYFDISGMTLEEMLRDVCKAILIDETRLVPDSVIADIEKKRKVAGLFRR